MKRKPILIIAVLLSALPGSVHAKVDTSCAGASATSAITGVVRNARYENVEGVTVEIQRSGTSSPAQAGVSTGSDGRYRICASPNGSAAGHDTYDVKVSDKRTASLYAQVSQPYTTYTNSSDADFTPDNGLPLLLRTTLTVTPAEISTKPGVMTSSGAVPVTWSVLSKAPPTATIKLSLSHKYNNADPAGEWTMSYVGTTGTAPETGGWNRWTYTDQFAPNTNDKLHWAVVRGLESVPGRGTLVTTQEDRQPYVIDNIAPAFGKPSPDPCCGSSFCGPGVTANALKPAETTNPQPIVLHGVCDYNASAATSGLDPFSLRGWMCSSSTIPTSQCTSINPVLNTFTVTWWPTDPLALGDYWLRWQISDKAGNTATNGTGTLVRVAASGGATPMFNDLRPGNLGNGSNLGFILGVSQASPQATPTIGFRVTDADGQHDIVIGSVRMRIYYPDDRSLIYEYDPDATTYNPTSRKGPGTFSLECGCFTATGFPLQGKPPGRYLATAMVNDHGGNTATVSWHWILVGAV